MDGSNPEEENKDEEWAMWFKRPPGFQRNTTRIQSFSGNSLKLIGSAQMMRHVLLCSLSFWSEWKQKERCTGQDTGRHTKYEV